MNRRLRRCGAPAQVDTRGVKQEMGDFAVRALASKARVITGNVVREFAKHAPAGARALVYAVSVEHSKQLVAEFRDAGCAAEHIDGGTAQRERDAIIARVRGGETRILCNCGASPGPCAPASSRCCRCA